MNFINFHIAYLLTEHDRVVIPDFGAFVVSERKDCTSKRQNFIAPPANYSLTFNPNIIRDDGALVRSVAKEKNVDYGDALHLIYEYVDRLVDDLRSGQTVQLPCIGKIHLSVDRKIVFTPARNLSCNAANCGLVGLYFPSLNESLADESTRKRKKIYRRPVFYIILAAIVLLLVLAAAFFYFKAFK